MPGETEYAYIWRLGEAKTRGILDLTWGEIGSLVNKEFRDGDEEFRTESAYRKQYQVSKLFFDHVFSKLMDEPGAEDLLGEQRSELYKLKKQLSDQRREYNKLLTTEARWENLLENLADAANRLNEVIPLTPSSGVKETDDSEAVLILSDWHYGMTADNIWNEYSVGVFQTRLKKLRDRVIRYLKRHNPSVLHVAILGDMVAGAIHVSSRVDSEEKTVEQIMHVSEYIAELVAELSEYAPKTKVYSTYGNHARTVQNHNDSIHSDNLERLIPWWMAQRLKGHKSVEIMENKLYEFLLINACGSNIVGVHGDLDRKGNSALKIAQLFSRQYGVQIDTILEGHIHHVTADEDLGVEVMTVGSMCGTDEYANRNRLYSNASQTLLFYSGDTVGKECRYDINLSY